jgi:hypothetical protein
MIAALEHQARGLSDLERELRRDQAVGAPANPVRSKIIAAHVTPSKTPSDDQTNRRRALNVSATTACPDFNLG